MSERKDDIQERDASLDREFEQLFSALNNVHASDELKSSTLAAIFEQMDEQEGDESAEGEQQERVVEPVVAPQLRLVDDEGDKPLPRAPRKPRRHLARVAAIIVALTLGLGGGVAYALPASHVTLTMDDTTFDLGVNVFGMTVSATADSEEGKQAIDGADIHNKGFKESLEKLMDRFDEGREKPAEKMGVTVEGGLGGGGAELGEQARRVVKAREESREAAAHEEVAAPTGTAAPTGAGEPVGVSKPAGIAEVTGATQERPTSYEQPRAQDTQEPVQQEPMQQEPIQEIGRDTRGNDQRGNEQGPVSEGQDVPGQDMFGQQTVPTESRSAEPATQPAPKEASNP